MDSLRVYLEKNLNVSEEEAKLIEKTIKSYNKLKESNSYIDDFGFALINLFPFTFQRYLASNIDSFTPQRLVTLLLYKLKSVDDKQYSVLSNIEKTNRDNPDFYINIYNSVKSMLLAGDIDFQ